MSASARAWSRMTAETFDARLERQGGEARWELVGGEIVAMTNPNEAHEQIVSNIAGPLLREVHGSRCHVYVGGMGVQRSEDSGGHRPAAPGYRGALRAARAPQFHHRPKGDLYGMTSGGSQTAFELISRPT